MDHATPQPNSAHIDPQSTNGTSKARPVVLYVEDHPVNVSLMEAVFARRPHVQLVVATTGEEALRMAADLNPALLLLDLNLPDCHGGDLLPRLRRLPGCQAAPAVAVTAHHDYAIAGTGFIGLWPKPLDLQAVFDCLDGLQAAEQTTQSAASSAAQTPHPPATLSTRLNDAPAGSKLMRMPAVAMRRTHAQSR